MKSPRVEKCPLRHVSTSVNSIRHSIHALMHLRVQRGIVFTAHGQSEINLKSMDFNSWTTIQL